MSCESCDCADPTCDPAIRHECNCDCHNPEPRVRYVNAYEVTLGCGGPEEGGWWFDCGEPLASIPCETAEQIEAAKAQINAIFFVEYDRRPPRSSVSGAAADLFVMVEDKLAEYWPQERPHYE